MTLFLRTGTVDVTQSSATVDGIGTPWLSQVNIGDFFTIGTDIFYEITAITDNITLTINPPYVEATDTGINYAIARVSPKWSLASDLGTRVGALIALIEAGASTIHTVAGAPSASLGSDGDYAYDPATFIFTGPKAAGAWPAGVTLGISVVGAWDSGTTYEKGQGVTHTDSFWIAKLSHSNKEPGVAGDWATYWDKAAAAGADGQDAGIKYTFDADTGDTDPGTGDLKLNNGTYSAVTEVYISDNEANGVDVQALLALLDDSTNLTNRGKLILQDRDDDTTFAVFTISGASTEATGYWKLAVTHVVSNNTFSAADSLSVQFTATGDKGTDGVSAGPKLTWSTNTADTDPGSGLVKVNNASLSAATKIYIDDADNDAADITAFILAMDDSTNPTKGTITLRELGVDANFAIYDVTGLTDNSGYTALDVTYVAGGGSFSGSDIIVVSFARAGNQGLDAGAEFIWDDGITDADPGNSHLRFDNATLTDVAELYIDDLDKFGVDVSAWIASWDDSVGTIKGQIIVREKLVGTALWIGNVTAFTTASGYSKITATHIDSNGTFTDEDSISVSFIRAGSEGGHQGTKFTFDANTDDTDPTSGKIKFNAGSFAATTQVFADDEDASGADVSSWMLTWDDSSNSLKATLVFRDVNDATTFAVMDINGTTNDATGYIKLQVTNVVSNGFFSAGDVIVVSPLITGDKGLDAAATGIEYDFDGTATTEANPGAGKLRVDNANIALVTECYINDAEANTGDMTSWLELLDDTTNTTSLGILTITELRSPENFGVYRVDVVADVSTYFKLELTHLGSNGSWSDLDRLSINFSPTGDKGLDAAGAGITYNFDVGTSDQDPGSGDLSINHSSIASATEIYINDSDANAASMVAWLNAIDDTTTTTSFGILTINELRDAGNFAVFKVTAIDDLSGYFKLSVTHLGSNGSWSAADPLLLNFSATGDLGTSGTDATEPGLQWNFDGASQTMGEPNVGDFRFNNAILTSVTAIAFDTQTTETGNPDAHDLLVLPDDITNADSKALIRFSVKGESETFAVFKITAVADNTSWVQYSVSLVESAGTISDNDPMVVQLSLSGNDGAGAVDSVDGLTGTVIVPKQLPISTSQSAPPGGPSSGDRHIVTATATGDWAGQETKIAEYNGTIWTFQLPTEGWEVYAQDENIRLKYDGSAWADHRLLVGINATADTTKRLNVKAIETLFDAETDDIAARVNKAATGDIAVHQYETATVKQARAGLIEDDNYSIDVTDDDGVTQRRGLVIDNATGHATPTQLKGADIASADPLVLGTDGNFFDVTGTTGFADITVAAGTGLFILQFDDVLDITSSASLKMPGDADYKTQAGDKLTCFATAANTVEVLSASRTNIGKNLVINAEFAIDQRGSSFAGLTASQYTLDRWEWIDTGTTSVVVTVTQDGSVPTAIQAGYRFDRSIKILATTAETLAVGNVALYLSYKIEAHDCVLFSHGSSDALDATLSFWFKSTDAGTFSVNIDRDDASEEYVHSFTCAANTWEKFTVVIPGDVNGTVIANNSGIGLAIRFMLAIGDTGDAAVADTWQASGAVTLAVLGQTNLLDTNNDAVWITGVKYEVGNVATPFESVPVATMLAMCQRYYEEAPGTGGDRIIRRGGPGATGVHYSGIEWAVRKRVTPTTAIKAPAYTNADTGSLANPSRSTGEIIVNISTAGGFMYAGYTVDSEL